jgi:tRNA 2-thiouridine synthesizing protein A
MSSPFGEPVVIDGGDRECAHLLMELRARLTGLSAGTMVHLSASDPAAPLDLAAWCHLTGHSYLGVVRPPSGNGGEAPVYALRVGASPRGTRPDSPWRPYP